jgi:hypothetical protein
MSSRRLEPGDLAICVNTDLPENNGVIVEVLAVGVIDPAWGDRRGPLCRIRVAGARSLHVDLKVSGRWRRNIGREAVVPESRLRRIAPPQRETSEVGVEELVLAEPGGPGQATAPSA